MQNKIKFSTRGISTPIGLLIIIICSVLTANLLVSQMEKVTEEIKEPEAETSEVKEPEKEIIPSEDETDDLSSKALAEEDWKTYRSEEYGFELKYPQNWEIKKQLHITKYIFYLAFDIIGYKPSDTEVYHRGYPLGIEVYQTMLADRAVTEWIKSREDIDFKIDIIETKIVDNKTVIIAEWDAVLVGIGHEAVILSEGYLYRIYITSSQDFATDTKTALDKILSTFKFIEMSEKEEIYQEVDVSEEMAEDYVVGYKIGNVEIKLSDGGIPPYIIRGGHFDIYNKGKKVGEGDAGASIFNLGVLAFDYEDNRYIIIPLYVGGASNPSEYYIYILDADENLKLISKEFLGFNDFSSIKNFLTEKNGKLYLKIVEGYSYDRRSITRILFDNYFLIEDGNLIKSNTDFKEEYIETAKSETWFLSKVINYLLAREEEKAWEIFYENIDGLYYDEYPPRKVDPEQIREEILKAIR